jgi:hypothetical protein
MTSSRREFIKVTAAAGAFGAQKARALPVQGVGIVSSIAYSTTRHQQEFTAGLNRPDIVPQYQDHLGYDNNTLSTAIQDFDNDPSIGIIVTFGGLIVWNATMNAAVNKPFISLIGGTPGNFPKQSQGTFIGYVNLNTYVSDLSKIGYLKNKLKLNDKDICLLYNPGSLMAPAEISSLNWSGATPVPALNGINNPSNFSLDLSKIAQPAVVISADPYFHHNREYLIAAANASGKYICYPLLSYRNINGTNKPIKGMATLYGPDLNGKSGGYYLVGQQTAAFFATGVVKFNTPTDSQTVDL